MLVLMLMLVLLLLLLLLLVIEAAHAGQRERVWRRSGRALAIMVYRLPPRCRIAILRRRCVSCRRTLLGVVMSSGRWIAHGVRPVLMRLLVMLLMLPVMASGLLRMGHE